MGLGRILTRGRAAAPQESTRAITEFALVDGTPLFGSSAAGRYRGAMSLPGAWRASLLLSDLIGQVPWDAYDGSTLITPRPPLLEQPSTLDTRMTTMSSIALDVIHDGNGVLVTAQRDDDGWPTAALPVAAQRMSVRRHEGRVEYQVGGEDLDELGVSTAPAWARFDAADVIHVKGPCAPGDLRGMGVLEAHLSGTGDGALELAHELQRQAGAIGGHGVPTGLLRSTNPDATRSDLMVMKAGWLEAQRARTVAAVNATTEFEPLSWNPDELQLVEARKLSLQDQALIYGVPLSFLGVETSNRTYRNDESEGISLLKFYLGGHIARIEAALSACFPPGVRVVADLDFVMRSDTLARYQAYAIGLADGHLTLAEVREMENRPPLPEPRPPADPPTPPTPTDDGGTTT